MTERVEVQPEDRAAWRAWLEANHASSGSIWLVFWKKESGRRKLTYEEAVLEALCFGWIDGQLSSIDAHRYRQIFAPRKPKSVWSAINKRRIEALVSANLMTPAGVRMIDVAKENGSWTSLDAIEAMEVPPAFTAALAKKPRLRAFFDGLSPGNRKGFLYFIGTPRTEAGRARRLEVALRLLAGGHTLRDYYFSKGAAERLKERAGASPTTKKAVAKKAVAKKAVAKKAVAKKAVAKKAVAKKAVAKKAVAKKAVSKKAVAKKAVAKKAVASERTKTSIPQRRASAPAIAAPST